MSLLLACGYAGLEMEVYVNENVKKPKVRFKGYEDAWEQRKLGDEAVEILAGGDIDKEKAAENGKYPIYANALTNDGVVGYYNDYFRVKAPAVTVTGRGEVGHAQARMTDFTPVVRLLAIRSNHDCHFLENTINNHKVVVESTGVPQLTVPQLSSYKLYFPKEIEEETKIGEYFHSLDHLITLHQRECEQAKKYKKYMLQKMFPQNGSNVPEIRFSGFTHPWEQRKLGELAEIVGGGTPSTGVDTYWDGDIDWYAPAEIGEQIYLKSSQRKITEEGLNKSSAKILPIGTVLFTSRAGIGKTAILLKEGCTNQGFQSIVPNKEKLDSYFIFTRSEELKKYGETVGAGSTFVEISGKQMANMELMMPKTMSEQQQIGQYFSTLDNLITLHQQKCEELQKIKKFMLQNMFV